MTKKSAYMRHYVEYGYCYNLVELTGKCKIEENGMNDKPVKYYERQVRLFGFALYKEWINESRIEFRNPLKVTIYNCDCEDDV